MLAVLLLATCLYTVRVIYTTLVRIATQTI
jgi:hypothetical protein